MLQMRLPLELHLSILLRSFVLPPKSPLHCTALHCTELHCTAPSHQLRPTDYIGKYCSRTACAHCISAVQCSSVQCSAVDWTGLDWTRLTGLLLQTILPSYSLCTLYQCSAVQCSTVQCGGLDWTGLDWTGLTGLLQSSSPLVPPACNI